MALGEESWEPIVTALRNVDHWTAECTASLSASQEPQDVRTRADESAKLKSSALKLSLALHDLVQCCQEMGHCELYHQKAQTSIQGAEDILRRIKYDIRPLHLIRAITEKVIETQNLTEEPRDMETFARAAEQEFPQLPALLNKARYFRFYRAVESMPDLLVTHLSIPNVSGYQVSRAPASIDFVLRNAPPVQMVLRNLVNADHSPKVFVGEFLGWGQVGIGDRKEFAFIKPEARQEVHFPDNIYMHRTNLAPKDYQPKEGEKVTFSVAPSCKGQERPNSLKAVNVRAYSPTFHASEGSVTEEEVMTLFVRLAGNRSKADEPSLRGLFRELDVASWEQKYWDICQKVKASSAGLTMQQLADALKEGLIPRSRPSHVPRSSTPPSHPTTPKFAGASPTFCPPQTGPSEPCQKAAPAVSSSQPLPEGAPMKTASKPAPPPPPPPPHGRDSALEFLAKASATETRQVKGPPPPRPDAAPTAKPAPMKATPPPGLINLQPPAPPTGPPAGTAVNFKAPPPALQSKRSDLPANGPNPAEQVRPSPTHFVPAHVQPVVTPIDTERAESEVGTEVSASVSVAAAQTPSADLVVGVEALNILIGYKKRLLITDDLFSELKTHLRKKKGLSQQVRDIIAMRERGELEEGEEFEDFLRLELEADLQRP